MGYEQPKLEVMGTVEDLTAGKGSGSADKAGSFDIAEKPA